MFSRIGKSFLLGISLLVGIFFTSSFVHASILSGTIDPRDVGNIYAALLNDTGFGTDTLSINFGKYTTQPTSAVVITDTGIRGHAWGELVGWIVMNCVSTVSGCSSTNDNFKVSVNSTGVLSGYAWGENTGWINFGSFTNSAISQVKIDENGGFGGTLGSAGYAWSENFGWIVFDCTNPATCVETDYRPPAYRPECSNNVDDDGDGDIDHPSDQGCTSIFDDQERVETLEGGFLPQCSNFKDDDHDGFIDYPNDKGCSNRLDSNEVDDIVITPIIPTPIIPTPPFIPPVDVPYPPQGPIVTPPSSGNGIVMYPPPTDTSIFTPSIELPPIVTHIIQGKASLPEAKDAFVEAIKEALRILKELFDQFIQFLRDMMTISSGKDLVEKISWLGLALVVFIALVISSVVPMAGPSEASVILPYLFHKIAIALGMKKADPLWGTAVLAGTNEPLSLGRVSLWSNGAFVASTIANPDGTFGFSVPNGNYTLSIDAHGKRLPFLPTNNPLGAPYFGEVLSQAPTSPLVLGVGDTTYPPVTPHQRWVLNREVSLMNISLFIFGIGALAALLYVIFYPGLMSFLVILLYGLVGVLRELGVFGSYASVYIDKLNGQPLAGHVVKVLDMNTRKVIYTTLTTHFGRAYLHLPKGYYAITLSRMGAPGMPPETITTPLFATAGGMHRVRLHL
jgi:hypothetical protein